VDGRPCSVPETDEITLSLYAGWCLANFTEAKFLRNFLDLLLHRGADHDTAAAHNRDIRNFGLLSFVGYLGTASGGNTLSAEKQRIVDETGALAEIGITHVTVMFNELNSVEPLQKTLDEAQWFAEEVIPLTRHFN
jgi:hypothetical protein